MDSDSRRKVVGFVSFSNIISVISGSLEEEVSYVSCILMWKNSLEVLENLSCLESGIADAINRCNSMM